MEQYFLYKHVYKYICMHLVYNWKVFGWWISLYIDRKYDNFQ